MSPSSNPEAELKTNPAPRRPHRLRSALLIVAGVLVLLVALAPTLLATRPVRGMILSGVNKDLHGRIELDDLSLGWFTGVDIHGLTVFDPQDRQVARVDRVKRSGGLIGLLFNRYALGRVLIEKPEIRLLTDSDGRFSLEKAFESRTPPKPRKKKPAGLEEAEDLSLDLQLRRGSVQLVRLDGSELWVRDIDANTSAAGLKDLRGDLKAALAEGRVAVEYALANLVERGELRLNKATGTAGIRIEQPLSVKALSGLGGGDKRADGKLSGNAAMDLKGGKWSAKYDAAAAGLLVGYGDSADLRPVDLTLQGQVSQDDAAQAGNISLVGQTAQGEIVRFETTWGLDTASLKDASPFSQVLAAMLAGGAVRLPAMQAQGKGNFDLVGLSQAVPALLALRRDLTLQEGRLDFDFQTDTRQQPQALATVKLSKIRARQADRPVEFEPIDGKLDFAWPKDKSVQGSVDLRGDIGLATLSSESGHLKGQLDLDLAPVQRRLEAMTELPAMQLAGRLTGQITAEDQRAQGKVPWTADLNGSNVAISRPGAKQPLRFAQLALKSNGDLSIDPQNKPTALNVADLNLGIDSTNVTGRGRYNLTTNSPEDFRLTAAAQDLRQVQGWLTALGYWPAETTLAGSANLSAAGQYETDGRLAVTVTGQGQALEVTQPKLRPVRWADAKLDAALNYNTRTRAIALADAGKPIQLSAPLGQVQVSQLSGTLEPMRLEMQAQVQDIDLGQLAVFGLTPEGTELSGLVSGPLAGEYKDGVLRLTRNELAVRQFVFARADIGRIDWPQATVNMPLEYDTGTTRFKLGSSPAVAKTPWGQLDMDLAGTAEPLTLTGKVRLQGLDAAPVTQALRPALGLGQRHFTGMVTLSADLRQPAGEPLVANGELRIEKLGTDRQLLSAEPMVLNWEAVRVDLQGPTAGKVVRADKVRLTSDIARANATNVMLDLRGQQPVLSAAVEAGADLKPLREAIVPLLADPSKLPPLAGQFTYRGEGRTENNKITVTGSANVTQLVVGEGQQAFRQDKMDVAHEMTIDSTQMIIQVTKFALTSPLFQTELTGTVTDYSGQQLLALTGRYHGDLDQGTQLLHQLKPQLVEDVKSVRGALDWPLAVSGSLADPKITPGYRQLDATAGVNWESVEAYGLTLGPGRIPLKLADGRIDIPATEVNANGGKMLLTGVVSLFAPGGPAAPAAAPSPAPAAMKPRYTLAGTHQVLKDVAITQEFSSKQLHRLNPVLFFQPKSISGAVSLTLTDVDLPLSEEIKKTGRIKAGRLDIHDLKMEPNSTFGEILGKMGQFTGGTGSIQTEGLDFRMENGRVYYEKFDIIFNNVYRFRFSGSVGLDNTVELTLNLPITPELLQKLGVRVRDVPGLNLTQLLTDVYVPVPITGGTGSMKPDFSGASKAAETIIQKAIENFIKGGTGVGGLLKDILPGGGTPPPPPRPGSPGGLRLPDINLPGQPPRQSPPAPPPPAPQPSERRPAATQPEDALKDALQRILEDAK